MTHPMSLRFRRQNVAERLKRQVEAERRSASAIVEELVDEGLRSRDHPLVVSRSGPTGRRAGISGGPDVWEIIGGMVGGDVPVPERVDRAIETFGWPRHHVDAALAYYADYSSEIDGEIDANSSAADDAEARWHRVRDALAR